MEFGLMRFRDILSQLLCHGILWGEIGIFRIVRVLIKWRKNFVERDLDWILMEILAESTLA